MKKMLRQRRTKGEQLIEDSSDDDGGGVTLSSDDANTVGNSSDGVLLRVKLLTEYVSGDDRESDVTAQIVSETSYEDWEVDIENEDYAGGLCELFENRNVRVDADNKVQLTIRSRGSPLKAGDIIGKASNPRPSRRGRFAREQRFLNAVKKDRKRRDPK